MKIFQTSGAVLGVALMVGGCSKAKDEPSADPGKEQQKIVCQFEAPNRIARDALQAYLSGIASEQARVKGLSLSARRELTRDVDLKGREIKSRSKREGRGDVSDFDAPWAHKDLTADNIPGTSTDRAYAELGLTNANEVVVAVIDSGMDIDHEDLKANIWTNQKELNGLPGVDDDGNGYVDDLHGWNYLVDKNGNAINWASLEVTRELRRLKDLEAAGPLSESDKALMISVQAKYDEEHKKASDRLALRTASKQKLETALETLTKSCPSQAKPLDENSIKLIKTEDPVVAEAAKVALGFLEEGWTLERFNTSIAHWSNTLQYQLNVNTLIEYAGDDQVFEQKGYGNNDVKPVADDEDHATHVAGIIGAVRDNGLGINGQAKNVKIMSLRVVPNGDERDKDISNAVRYAVDNGARVINMSFGKALSPQRKQLWETLAYAASKNVLVVHAAGNDSKDNDINPSFPNRFLPENGVTLELNNFVEVGASTVHFDAKLPADFTNFGNKGVDVFAPGDTILSTVPGNGYEEFGGTSMASPEVAGIAALVLGQKDVSASWLREKLMSTVTPLGPLMVKLPGSDPQNPATVPFSSLSVADGVVNAHTILVEALKQ